MIASIPTPSTRRLSSAAPDSLVNFHTDRSRHVRAHGLRELPRVRAAADARDREADEEDEERDTCVEIKFYGAFVLILCVNLHAIDALPARWRGDAGSLPLDGASTEMT